MALLSRISRLFQADVHAVLDQVEEPLVLLRQAIRDMEAALAEDERLLQLNQHERTQLGQRLTQLDQSSERIKEELEVCFMHHKEDLARHLIRRQLETNEAKRLLTLHHNSLEEQAQLLTGRLSGNRVHLESTRQKATLLSRSSGAAVSGTEVPVTVVSDEDVEVAFLRARDRWQS